MNKIDKNNLLDFINYYHAFHDSWITNINYDIVNSKIEMSVCVDWSGKSIVKEDGKLDTNKVKMKVIFNDVEKCEIREYFSWDFIKNIYIKYITLDGKEFVCFANEEENPEVYIICNNIEYEEIKD